MPGAGSTASFDPPVVLRATSRSHLAAAFLGGFFLLIGVVLWRESPGAWPVVALAAAATTYLVVAVAALRLEITHRGVRYRTLRGSRALDFQEMKRGYFQTMVNRAAPRGLHVFSIEPQSGAPLAVNLRAFTPEGVALLLAALERHGIPIEAPGAELLRAAAREQRPRIL